MEKYILNNKADIVKWEDFKTKIEINKKDKIFGKASNLGNCDVHVSFMEGELYFEILPNETTDMNGEVPGIVSCAQEDNCDRKLIMEMANNSRMVKEAKKSGKPIKKFTI